MALSHITALIIFGFLFFSLAQPAVAQVPEWRMSLPDDAISNIALSSNGDYVVIGSTKGEVHLFTRTGSELWAEEFAGDQLVKIADDGSRIFTGSQEALYSDKGAVRIFNQNGTLLSKTSTGWVTGLALARNHNQLAVGTMGGGVYMFNRDGVMYSLLNDPMLTDNPIASVAISADGSTIAYSVYSNQNPSFIINRKKINKKISTLNVFTSIAASSNGTDIATSEGEGSRGIVSSRYNNGTALWNAKTPRVNDLKISEDGSLVVAGCTGGSVVFFNRTGDIVWDFSTDKEVSALSINSPATNIVAGTTNGTLYLLDNEGALLWKYHDDGVMIKPVTALEISRDGSTIIVVLGKRDLLFFMTSKILLGSLAQSPNGNLSLTSPEVNVSGLDPYNASITLLKPENFPSALTGNSKLFTEIRDIVRNLKSGGVTFDHRGGTSSWITMEPLVIFPHGNTFSITRNLSGNRTTSNNAFVKSSPILSGNSIGAIAPSGIASRRAVP